MSQQKKASSPPEPRYFNRELSWLEFNQRVLDEACNTSIPLLERLKFLAITASNLDEFFMVRVGGLQQLKRQDNLKHDPIGLTASMQLSAIRERVKTMLCDQYNCFLSDLEPALTEAGIRRFRREDLVESQVRLLREVFQDEIFPVYTPMAVTSETFPLLANQSLNICVQLAPESGSDEPRFALIPLGRLQQRFLTLPSERGYSYIMIEDVVQLFIEEFFPGNQVQECSAFRMTRNADLALREDAAADLLAGMEEILTARKESVCVRLEISAAAGESLVKFLLESLGLQPEQVWSTPGPLDMSAFFRLSDLSGFDGLKYESWPSQPSPDVDLRVSMFENIARHDILLHHPYDSFEPVVRLLQDAADDPDVLAIKQTLYRTSQSSPIVAALRRAAEKGKQVTAIVELKARFDEARNIEWAKQLEHANVQVIYGVRGLKTHAKVCIVVRREPHGIQRYMHFGTGNYNESTARLYGDVSLMTCDEQLGTDASSFFNAIAGYSQPQAFRKLEAAPLGLRERLLEMIETETHRKRQGQKAHIVAKLNSLVDPKIIDALYEASQAGVSVKLNIRGICCLRPGVPGLSENIEVISIIDRYLEHSRILYFFHGGDERVFLSSADWMPRNLDRRVELLVPVEDTNARHRLISCLDMYFRDNVKARRLQPDGSYQRVTGGGPPLRSQQKLYEDARIRVKNAEQSRRTVFEPHRAEETE